jgi:hypothetical protein
VVQRDNVVAIETAPGDRLLVGALAITVQLADGRRLRTPVDPWLYATSNDWDAWQEPRLRHVPAGQSVTARLCITD